LIRCLALFLGGFTLLNLLGSLLHPGFDQNLMWIDLQPVPEWIGRFVLGGASLLLLVLALGRTPSPLRRRATALAVGLLLAAAIASAIRFHGLVAANEIRPALPLSLSGVVAVLLGLILVPLLRTQTWRPPSRLMWLVGLPALAVGFPLAQMVFFGGTDYRRPADAIVVFGARTYANGRPSTALADRVRTGCVLYREGLAPLLVLSGGPGEGDVHETEAMRRLAIEEGVPGAAIRLDPVGLDTRATAANTAAVVGLSGRPRILAVSHRFHLPRVKMAYARIGLNVYTVPAVETWPASRRPSQLIREVAAFWFYWVRDAL
jgi:uncharacterized SAM-binding protein YcdF (DUF218 family)